jgi:hypothetical protein
MSLVQEVALKRQDKNSVSDGIEEFFWIGAYHFFSPYDWRGKWASLLDGAWFSVPYKQPGMCPIHGPD